MTTTIWSAIVSAIGTDSAEMLEGGVLILFGEPVPSELADVSIVHTNAKTPTRPIATGDTFTISGQEYRIDEVGSRANENLTELGHIVLYINQAEQQLLPGAIKATGPDLVAPDTGTLVTVTGA